MFRKSTEQNFLALLFCFLVFAVSAFASATDSLISLADIATTDTARIRLLNTISWEFKSSDPQEAQRFADSALTISKRINFKQGESEAFKNLGVIEYLQGNYDNAIPRFEAALRIMEELHDKKNAGKICGNLGLAYAKKGNYPLALEYHLKSLKNSEEVGNKQGISASLNNIGIILLKQGNVDKALEYYKRSLEISRELADKSGISNNLINIGNIYLKKAQQEEALTYFFQSLELRKELNNKKGVYSCYNNIGSAYMELSNYTEALKYLDMALAGKKEINDDQDIPSILLNIGYIYEKQKVYNKALEYMKQSLNTATEIENIDYIKQAWLGLSVVYDGMNNHKEGYAAFKNYVAIKDSLVNGENTDRISELQTLYQTEKKDKEIQLLNKEKELQQANINRQRVVIISAVLVLVLAFSLAYSIFKGKKRSDELLLNILPAEVAEELKEKGYADARLIEEVTVLFTDFKGFTAMSEKLSPKELVKDLHECFSAFDLIMEKHGMEKIKTIGDAYMAAGGLPTKNSTHATDAIKAALEMRDFVEEGKAKKIASGLPFFEIRIGIHTGPVVAGIVGIKKFQYDIWGDTVNTASRMESSGEVGKVNISESTYELVKDIPIAIGINFEYRGEIEAKGKGKVKMYFVNV
jgi:adenylate cyclase